MATTSKYFVVNTNGDNTNFIDFDLRYGALTTVGESIQYNGSNSKDAIFVRPGLTYDLSNTAGANDKIYLTGSLSDYALQVDSVNHTLTLTRSNESVKVSKGTPIAFDSLIFSNGMVNTFALFNAVVSSVTLTPDASVETSLAPLATSGAGTSAVLNATINAYAINQSGGTFASVKPGVNLIVNGSNGVDKVYVADGASVNATNLAGGVDLIYMRGNWADYTKALDSVNHTITFTRTINGKIESVIVATGTSTAFDRVIFADGTVTTADASVALTGSLTAPIAGITGYNPAITTPLYNDTQVADALAVIRDAAQGNTATSTTPSLLTYVTAGVTGVTAGNLAAINSALNSASVTGTQADTAVNVQAIITAYTAILAEANDAVDSAGDTTVDATPLVDPTVAQYSAIGVTLGTAATDPENLALLNDIVGAKQTVDVDTVAEINELARIANAIQTVAADGTPSPALTVADLTKAGLNTTNLTLDNLTAVLSAIAAKLNDGSETDSLPELQAIINSVDTSSPTITTVAFNGTTGANNGWLNAGDVVSVTVTFNEAVNVSGIPQLALNIGGTTVQANYLSGSGSSTLSFSYTIQAGAGDSDGISIDANSLSFNAGNIKDSTGNVAVLTHLGVSDANSYRVDTTAPTTTVSTTAFSADTGTSTTDFITKTAAQTITGTLSAVTVSGEVIQVSLDNGTTWNTATNTIGSSTYSYAATLTASNTLQVRVSDTAGNVSTALTQAYVLDTVAPTLTVSAIALSVDSGISTTDFNTNIAAQTISATLSAALSTGDILSGSLDNGTTWIDITSKVSGTAISWTGATLSGSSSIVFRVTDLAGNVGSNTGSTAYVLDTTAPTVTITESHVGTLNIGSTSSVTFTFSEAVQGFANGDVTVSGGTLSNVTVSGTDPKVYTATFTAVGSASISVGANSYTDAAGNNGSASNSLALTVQAIAGDAFVALGAGLGQLMAPVQVEGKWYYYWDLSGNGSATVSGTGANGVATNATNGTTAGSDFANHDFFDSIFTQSIYGDLGGANTTDTYRYATINGIRVALPTIGGTSAAPYGPYGLNQFQPGTSASFNTTADNSAYNDYLAIWDSFNGTGTVTNVSGVPVGWLSGYSYWSATTGSEHALLSLDSGIVNPGTDALNSRPVALQVLAPTTLTAASYYAAGDTFTVTGTAFDSAGNVGDDIKAQLDWSKFGYDTNGDGVRDVTFAASDIASATVLSATQLNIQLTTTKATALEAASNFDLSSTVGGADKVITSTGFTDTVYNTSTQVRSVWQTQDASSLGVTQKTSFAGDAIIDLGSSGKLIAPVQVEGKWYYYWDRSGDGTSANTGSLNGGVDYVSSTVLQGIFNKDINGVTGTQDPTYRYSTINGIKLAMLTEGWSHGSPGPGGTSFITGTSYNDAGATSNGTINAAYNDYAAIWDAYNGSAGGTGYAGVPASWSNVGSPYFWTSSQASFNPYYGVNLSTGSSNDLNVNSLQMVALQVLPIVIDLNHDGVLSYGNVVMDVNGDGLLDATRWAGAQDGVLVWDKYHDGQVHDHSQYAFAQYDTTSSAQGKTATDLSGLAQAFDSNHDGVFDAKDAQFADFTVWQDANQNGVSDAGEVKTLAELGLASFSLSSDGVARTPVAGVFEAGHTTATATDGTQVLVADVGFDFSTLPSGVSGANGLSGANVLSGALPLIDLSADPAANSLKLNLSDVLALPQQTLVVQGAANDSVLLAGEGWTNTGTLAAQNGHTYAVWHNNTAQALIDQQVMTAGVVMHA